MLFGFWFAAVIVGLGFIIMAAELAPYFWPRRAGRRADSTWRADGALGKVMICSHYYAEAPGWYRRLTAFWHGWRWVRL